MPNGIHNKILTVDLTTRTIGTREPGESHFRALLGGWGLIAHELLTSNAAALDAYDPGNPLVFATGVVTGARVPGSGRHAVGAKSPLTGGFGEADVGGFWGAELKYAGYDAVVITGRSETPVYLWIKDEHVEIRDAEALWGAETADVQARIRTELGDDRIRVAQCGIAGENLVRYACVIHDVNRAAGRCGLGAVMGSKNLKAVAVRGSQLPEAADPEKLQQLMQGVNAMYEHFKNFRANGTGGNVTRLQEAGQLPTRNFQNATFDQYQDICGTRITKEFLVGQDTCTACPIGCKRKVKVEGRYNVDPVYGGPEYETIGALGSICEVADLEAILYANQLCNAYGLDTISTGVTIGWAMECFDRGLLTIDDTDGLEIRFGDAEIMVQLVEQIARREGFGELLAEGSLRAARTIGRDTEQYAIQTKGQEAPMHDPRVKYALGLGYATSPTGADHIHNIHDTRYESDAVMQRLAMLGIHENALAFDDLGPKKIRLATYEIIWTTVINCIGLCAFTPYGREKTVDMIRGITGWDANLFELMKAGERALAMARMFNARAGFTAADDTHHPRFAEALGSGPHAGSKIDNASMQQALELYYEMMGWDKATGAPTTAKAFELGLDAWVDTAKPVSAS